MMNQEFVYQISLPYLFKLVMFRLEFDWIKGLIPIQLKLAYIFDDSMRAEFIFNAIMNETNGLPS